MASEAKVDLSEVKGSGKNGVILKEDIMNLMGSKPAPSQRKIKYGPEERVKMTRLRLTIAKILKEAQDSQGPLGYQVSVYQPEEYKGMQMIASPNADAGFAITPKGEIVSLVKNKNSQAKQFAKRALNYAYGDGKGNNGVFLNAFDTELTRLYRNAGFKPVSRTAFDEKLFRREIGDKAVDEFMEATKRFNDGRPDIVFMVRDPNVATKGSTKVQNFPLPQGEPKGTYAEATADLLTEMMRLGYIDELEQRNYR